MLENLIKAVPLTFLLFIAFFLLISFLKQKREKTLLKEKSVEIMGDRPEIMIKVLFTYKSPVDKNVTLVFKNKGVSDQNQNLCFKSDHKSMDVLETLVQGELCGLVLDRDPLDNPLEKDLSYYFSLKKTKKADIEKGVKYI